ncbi:MAG: hypothetical protein JWN85_2048, partial [Gammaproteobacteria bacterium]|nr:hypothetical protein [Gammaproteobacteria bacterium]
MSLQDQLQAELQRRQAGLNRTSVFSVFNIGTGHTQAETNNTIAALGHACTGSHLINDGPTGALGTSLGWGMNDALARTMNAIKAAKPSHVNLAGHSRGAILCHMVGNALLKDPATQNVKVNMIVLDPVHQSKLTHEGAESLPESPNLLSYHAIIMENENAKIAGNSTFPFKFVESSASTKKKMHYINLVGTHGSGTQNLTSPIGAVAYELIATFMRARRTEFRTIPKQPLEMCDLFAAIHALNPLSVKDATRLIFDDGGLAQTHDPTGKKATTYQAATLRANDVKKALSLNSQTAFRPGTKVLPATPISSYIFNQEHAFYFKAAFPYFFSVLAAVGKAPLVSGAFDRDFNKLLMG